MNDRYLFRGMTDDNKTIKILQELECYTGLQQKYTIALHNVIVLINRQKAEIERLNAKIKAKDEINYYDMGQLKVARDDIKTAKSEAIKEFAQRLKSGVPQETGVIRCVDVDNLVKEMTEVEE